MGAGISIVDGRLPRSHLPEAERWRAAFSAHGWARDHVCRARRIIERLENRVHQGTEIEGDRPHIPVMLDEVQEALALSPGETAIDATFGAGGYTRAMLDAGADVLAIDRDPDAIAAGQALVQGSAGRLRLVQGRFSDLDALAKAEGFDAVDAVVADIGVSSMQIDQGERGFSFMREGPLDMRMEQAGVSAADVVNHAPRNELTRIIGLLGEEKQANRVAAEIERTRSQTPFATTGDLVAAVERAVGLRRDQRIHPATRTFQALRIFVNRELEQLADALLAAERILKPGGRLVIVSFHSLEDRIVKKFLADRAQEMGGSRHLPAVPDKTLTFVQKKRGAVSASDAEAVVNPRARSAKLRAATRTDAPAPDRPDRKVFGLARLPDLDDFARAET